MTQMEPTTQMALTETDHDSWKMKSYIIGGMVGATVGFVTAVMLGSQCRQEARRSARH